MNYKQQKKQMIQTIIQVVLDNPQLTVKQISELVGAPESSVVFWCYQAGVKRQRGRKPGVPQKKAVPRG